MSVEAFAFKSAQARYAAHTARVCGYVFRSLDGQDGYCFAVRDGERGAVFAAGGGSPYALNDVRAASVARDKVFCAEALRLANVPVLEGRMFFATDKWVDMRSPGREPSDARAYARQLAYPVFCKPIAGSNGLFAEVIDDAAAFDAYLDRVSEKHFAILIQPYVQAPEYRVFVLEGKALFSYRKRIPEIEGDGVSSVRALARAKGVDGDNIHPRSVRGERREPDWAPARGERVVLAGPANRSAGGTTSDLRDGAPSKLAALALKAAEALRLRIAGVDMFAPADAEPLVIEVNSNPMIATLEDHGRWDLIETIWRTNFEVALR